MAWNSPSNQANQAKLVATRPITGVFLDTGVTSSVTWSKGTPARRTSPQQTCLLTVVKGQNIQFVTGVWRAGRVGTWSFGRELPVGAHPPANVRLLADGRVTKIYR
jgi:hypothetical protein